MEWRLTDSGEIPEILNVAPCLNLKFHGDWLQCYKTILGKVSAILYANRHLYA